MRVLHFYDEHQPVKPGTGSLSSAIYHVARESVHAGHDVMVVERQWSGFEPTDVQDGIQFKRLNMAMGSDEPGVDIPHKLIQQPSGLIRMVAERLEFTYRLCSVLDEFDPDVVHAHLPFSANILIHVRPSTRDNLVFTAHIGEEAKRLQLDEDSSGILSYLSPDLYLMERAAETTVLNPDLEQRLRDRKGFEDLHVVPNGVDLEDFNPSTERSQELRNKYDIKNDRPLVMFCGSITPRKGVKSLIEATGSLLSEGVDCHLVAVGDQSIDQEYVKEIYELVESQGHESRISLPGYIPYEDLRELYAMSDIFVLPSQEEGFGMVLTEALAAGTAVIGTRVGGIPLQIKDGRNGFLIETDNRSQLISKLSYLVQNPDVRDEMGVESRTIAENNFSWEAITEMYIQVYKNILQQEENFSPGSLSQCSKVGGKNE